MNKITKKSAFGIADAAAATLLVGGFAAPALAATATDGTVSPETSGTAAAELTQLQLDALDNVGLHSGDVLGGELSNESPVVVAPEVGVGDVGSGNETAVGNNVGTGNDIGASVSDVVDSSTGISSDVSDIVDDVDVDGLINDITDDLDLGAILGR